MIWVGIIKQVEIISPISQPIDSVYDLIKFINLKKVRNELIELSKVLKRERRYSKRESMEYVKRRMLKKKEEKI